MSLQAPFPYFGGKSRVAEEVWKRFGSPKSYIEPFCGSMAVLLHKEVPTTYETVNDLDGLLTNFWRAIKFDPEGVAELADAPNSEIDMCARHNWVLERKELITSLQEDPDFYDVKAAAFWVYVRSSMIGGDAGMFGKEFNNRVPQLSFPRGIHAACRRDSLVEIFKQVSSRLRKVTICCGDWKRILTNPNFHSTPVAIFLDPPYQEGEFSSNVYEHSTDVFSEVRDWSIENGNNPEMRIALCGYEGNEMPSDWITFEWKTGGGYGKSGKVEGRGKENATRERIWFSPHCLNPNIDEPNILDAFLK